MPKNQVTIFAEYLGDLDCRVTHLQSGHSFLTTAPIDNQGRGDHFSPTDLVATAFGSCILTIMGIKAKQNSIDLVGTKVEVLKEMQNEPYRRISKLILNVNFQTQLSEKDFVVMKNVIKTCPVTRSLHPEIEIIDNYFFPELV